MANDFDANATNNAQDTRAFGGGSGLKAGVESGLSSVESLSRGEVQAEQKTSGSNFKQDAVMSSGGSKNGKSFTFKN